MACGTCHNWLVVSSVMNLTRTTTRTEAHSEVWHALEQGLERLHVIPANECQKRYL
jgi:aminoglycoside phosphotransferase